MKGKMKEKMKRHWDVTKWKKRFFQIKCCKTLKPARWISQNVSKKIPFGRIRLFSLKVQNLTVFSFIYMIRIRFFGSGELNQSGLGPAQYLLHFLWTLLTTRTSSQVMSPTPTTSRRLTSSLTQSPWPTPSSPSKGSSRTWSTMTPHSRICFAKHTEYMSITPSEKACLSVSRRRPCPSERSDLSESERGELLDQLVRSSMLQMHRLELCWTDRKELNLSQKNFTALKLKNFNDEINNFFMNGYCSKIRNFVTLIIKKSQWNGRIKEVSEFHLRHYCKTKISRGPGN